MCMSRKSQVCIGSIEKALRSYIDLARLIWEQPCYDSAWLWKRWPVAQYNTGVALDCLQRYAVLAFREALISLSRGKRRN